jgi:hypothetical protein
MTKSLPNHYVFCFLLLLCFEISGSSKFLIGGRESSKMAVVYGECGRECLSGPCNTGGSSHRHKSSACSKFDIVWLNLSPIPVGGGGEGGDNTISLVQMIFTCIHYTWGGGGEGVGALWEGHLHTERYFSK